MIEPKKIDITGELLKINDKTLNELRYYFTGYGSPHDETILKLIERNKQLELELSELQRGYNESQKEISILNRTVRRLEDELQRSPGNIKTSSKDSEDN